MAKSRSTGSNCGLREIINDYAQLTCFVEKKSFRRNVSKNIACRNEAKLRTNEGRSLAVSRFEAEKIRWTGAASWFWITTHVFYPRKSLRRKAEQRPRMSRRKKGSNQVPGIFNVSRGHCGHRVAEVARVAGGLPKLAFLEADSTWMEISE